MALEADILDYVGRTVDMLAYDNLSLSRETLLSQQLVLPGQSGALISGIQKLVQRYLLELLTELGSLTYLPRRGCLFMLEARLGLWRTTADVESSFYSSMLDVRRNLILEENESDPLEERFDNADLLSVVLSTDHVVIQVQVTSLAGTGRDILLPLRVTSISQARTS